MKWISSLWGLKDTFGHEDKMIDLIPPLFICLKYLLTFDVTTGSTPWMHLQTDALKISTAGVSAKFQVYGRSKSKKSLKADADH